MRVVKKLLLDSQEIAAKSQITNSNLKKKERERERQNKTEWQPLELPLITAQPGLNPIVLNKYELIIFVIEEPSTMLDRPPHYIISTLSCVQDPKKIIFY